MRQDCLQRVLGLGLFALLVGVMAAGCEGEIGESVHPASGRGDGGVTPPIGAPGEIDGSGGGTGSGGGAGLTGGGTGGHPMATDAGGLGGSIGSGGTTGNPDALMGSAELAHGITISEVSIYQAAKVLLTKMGQPVATLDTPLVANRPALVRVSVTPDAGWQPRPIVARLVWGAGGAARDVSATITAASTDATLASTLNFNLAAADLTAQVEWSVSLHEAAGGTGAGATTGAAMPADGSTVKLATVDSGKSLKIVFVPIRNAATLPDTSPAQIKLLTDAMFSTYPVAKVEATVRDPIDFPTKIAAQGPGWDQALNQVCMTRQTDQPAHNVFYYGLVTPGPFQTYCAGGCVEGIAVLAQNPSQDLTRCSMGIGYTGQGTGVFLQEVAHSMGRAHAPCGQPAQPDRLFPYANGRIGVWGYDLVRLRLIEPTKTADFMSYCNPVWISDYTFAKLLPWIKSVNALSPSMLVSSDPTSPELASLSPSVTQDFALPTVETDGTPTLLAPRFAPARWRTATVTSDGSIVWGQVIKLGELSGAITHDVVVRDAAGKQTTVTGLLYPHSNTGGGLLLLPESVSTRPTGVKFGALLGFRNVTAE